MIRTCAATAGEAGRTGSRSARCDCTRKLCSRASRPATRVSSPTPSSPHSTLSPRSANCAAPGSGRAARAAIASCRPRRCAWRSRFSTRSITVRRRAAEPKVLGMSGRATEIAVELYALAPEQFTAARDSAAKHARDDGDRDLAATIKHWRRPSLGAWLVNQLVRVHPDELDDLLDLGAALREAQDALDGAELRTLSRQRHQAIRGLSELAREQRTIADAAQREFESTLDAAL